MGQFGQSCNQVCEEKGHVCDSTVMKDALTTKEKFQAAMNSVYPCNDPLFVDCSAYSLSTTGMFQGRCFYSEKQQCLTNSGANGAGDADPCANTATTNHRRFCACKSIRRMLKAVPRTTLTVSQKITERVDDSVQYRKAFQQEVEDAWETGSSTVHGTSAEENLPPPHQGDFLYNPLTGAIIRNERNIDNLKINRSIVVTDEMITNVQTKKNPNHQQPSSSPLSSAAAARSSSMSLFLLTLILCLFFMVSEVEAHNWIGRSDSPGRASISVSVATRRPSVSSF